MKCVHTHIHTYSYYRLLLPVGMAMEMNLQRTREYNSIVVLSFVAVIVVITMIFLKSVTESEIAGFLCGCVENTLTMIHQSKMPPLTKLMTSDFIIRLLHPIWMNASDQNLHLALYAFALCVGVSISIVYNPSFASS